MSARVRGLTAALNSTGKVKYKVGPSPPHPIIVSSVHLTRVLMLLSTSWLSEQVRFSMRRLVGYVLILAAHRRRWLGCRTEVGTTLSEQVNMHH